LDISYTLSTFEKEEKDDTLGKDRSKYYNL
jgi:hypothetical protein